MQCGFLGGVGPDSMRERGRERERERERCLFKRGNVQLRNILKFHTLSQLKTPYVDIIQRERERERELIF